MAEHMQGAPPYVGSAIGQYWFAACRRRRLAPSPTILHLRLSPAPLQSLAIAEPLDGPTLQRYRQLAAATGLWLSVGGFQERGPDSDHLYNCHVIINAAGDIVASYRKIHLFNVDVPGRPVLMESRCGVGVAGGRAAAWGSQAGRQAASRASSSVGSHWASMPGNHPQPHIPHPFAAGSRHPVRP